jgi:hypothetical protein
MGLKVSAAYALTFSRCQLHFRENPTKALVVQFRVGTSGSHAVAFFRESSDCILFYDANAGSYRVAASGLGAFLTQYNDVCLPLKWPGKYDLPATYPFLNAYVVDRA